MNQQWIRASEQMPESQARVLVATSGDGWPRVFEGVWLAHRDLEYDVDDYYESWCDVDEDENWWWVEGWYGVSFYDGFPGGGYTPLEAPAFAVTHWMPMPTHPRTAREEG